MSNHTKDSNLTIAEYAAQLADGEPSPVLRTWLKFTGTHSWSQRELWLNFVDDGEPTPVLVQLEDIPARPDRAGLDGLMHMCSHLAGQLGPGSFAFLLVRPGTGDPNAEDRQWAAGILAAAQESGIPLEPLHHANDLEVRAFAPDELVVPV